MDGYAILYGDFESKENVVCVDWSRDAVGKFPDYPTEEDGGSLMIFKEKDPAEVEAALKALVSTAF